MFNGSEFLAETVESALTQNFSDFELIAVDDGSTDSSVAVLEKFTDRRIRIVRQANQGTAGAICTGLKSARGKYIAFLDQDDIWEPESLAAHMEFLEANSTIDLSFSWFRIIDEHGGDMGLHSHRYQGTIGFEGLLEDFVIGGNSNVVARRDAIERAGGVDRELSIFFNMDMALRISLLREQENIAAIPRELMRYRRHPGQLSRQVDRLKQEWSLAIEKLQRIAPERVRPVAAATHVNFNRYIARLRYEQRRFGDALGELNEGFRIAPLVFGMDPRNWITIAACLAGLMLPRPVHIRLERLAGFRR